MKLIRRFYLIFFVYSILAFFSVKIAPNEFWWAGILSFTIIPCFMLNVLFFVYFLVRRRLKYFALTILLFALGFTHAKRTFQINLNQNEGNIKVLNSNVRIFNVYHHLRNENVQSSKEMINWISNFEADVLILQEFYNLDTSKIWSTTKEVSKSYPYHYFEIALYNRIDAEFGQVIFSKHPIINAGKIIYKDQLKRFNQAIFVDIKYFQDTVRVYNIHLESMKIEERNLFNDKNDQHQIIDKVKDTLLKLIMGAQNRGFQVNKIVEHIINSPYPVILGADMNDTPYSYAYDQFVQILNNSFEEKGTGFGFTFNGKLFFLRIDNLFSSDHLEVNSFNVHREVSHSDHFPISATYTLKK